MKKAMVALMLLCAATLFAGTVTRTITLVSVVEEVKPDFGLDVSDVLNGNSECLSNSEVSISSLDIKKDTQATLVVYQSLSKFRGQVDLCIKVSELSYEGYSTSGLALSVNLNEARGRMGFFYTNGSLIRICLNYNGTAIDESKVAEIKVLYKGNEDLPEGNYVSYVSMIYEAK